MLVGIVGAGFSGLVSAKTLLKFGHQVIVWDKAPDIGGVWSKTRHYPGLKTQNVRVCNTSEPEKYNLTFI